VILRNGWYLEIGRDIPYRNLSGKDYAATLLGFGLSQAIIDVVIDADSKSIRGDLNSTSRDLSRLIGKPTTTLSGAVRSALRTL
jgi:NAD(P)H dehydrogenase (quinone)